MDSDGNNQRMVFSGQTSFNLDGGYLAHVFTWMQNVDPLALYAQLAPDGKHVTDTPALLDSTIAQAGLIPVVLPVVAWSNNAKLAYQNDTARVWLHDLATGASIQLIPHTGSPVPRVKGFSPDGKYLAYQTHEGLFVLDVDNSRGPVPCTRNFGGKSLPKTCPGLQVEPPNPQVDADGDPPPLTRGAGGGARQGKHLTKKEGGVEFWTSTERGRPPNFPALPPKFISPSPASHGRLPHLHRGGHCEAACVFSFFAGSASFMRVFPGRLHARHATAGTRRTAGFSNGLPAAAVEHTSAAALCCARYFDVLSYASAYCNALFGRRSASLANLSAAGAV